MPSSNAARHRRPRPWSLRPSVLVVLTLLLAFAATSIYLGRPAAPPPERPTLPIAADDTPATMPAAAGIAAAAATAPGSADDALPASRPAAARPGPGRSALGFTVAVRPLDQAETDPGTALIYAGVYESLLAELGEIPELDLIVLASVDERFDPEIVDFLLEPRSGSSRSYTELQKFRVDWTATRGGHGSWVAGELGFSIAIETLAREAARGLREYPFPPEDGLVLALEGIVLNSTFPLEERVAALDRMRKTAERHAFVGRDERRQVAHAAVEIAATVDDSEIRGLTWRAMHGLEDPYLVAPLTDTVLMDPSEFVRIEAVKLLSVDYGEDPQAQSALEYALVNDLSSRVRMHARWESLDEQARQELLAATLLDTGRTDAERFELLLAELRDVRRYLDRPSTMALAEISARARPTTQEPLANEVTGDVGAAEVVPVLIEMLEDQTNDVMIRSTMVSSLVRHIEEPGVRGALERAARNDPSDRIRNEIYWATGSLFFRRPRN